MYYTIYKITNGVNGKIYIGAHKTENLDDGYMGSGVHLGHAKKKYGLENFSKEILSLHADEKEMYDKEAELVTLDFIKESTNYNKTPGGHGGWNHIVPGAYQLSAETRKRIGNKLRGRKHTTEAKEKMSAAQKRYIENGGMPTKGMTGKKHTSETRRKQSDTKIGKGNPNFGRICITNGVSNKQIHGGEIIPNGWYRGRYVSDETKRKQSEAAKARILREKDTDVKSITKKRLPIITS